MLTYRLFKTQSMLLSAITRKGQPNADLHTIQKPQHALINNKQEEPARCWLTCCSKPRTCSCQQQAWRASQMLTYSLFKTQSMISSATGRKGQPDANLLAVKSPEHFHQQHAWRASQMLTYILFKTNALVSNKQEGPARCWLTSCSKPRACSCQHQAGKTSEMLTYKLFKTQSMHL